MFSEYGEVTNSKTLAAAIVTARTVQPFKTISDLLAVLSPLSKGNPNRYYSQVFQALRIAVNEEMGALEDLLGQLVQVVKPGGRVAIITFHSLEDRIVKQFFKLGAFEVKEDPVYGRSHVSPFRTITKKPVVASANELKLITKKPVIPTKQETDQNKRSRSAKLRVAEKLEMI